MFLQLRGLITKSCEVTLPLTEMMARRNLQTRTNFGATRQGVSGNSFGTSCPLHVLENVIATRRKEGTVPPRVVFDRLDFLEHTSFQSSFQSSQNATPTHIRDGAKAVHCGYTHLARHQNGFRVCVLTDFVVSTAKHLSPSDVHLPSMSATMGCSKSGSAVLLMINGMCFTRTFTMSLPTPPTIFNVLERSRYHGPFSQARAISMKTRHELHGTLRNLQETLPECETTPECRIWLCVTPARTQNAPNSARFTRPAVSISKPVPMTTLSDKKKEIAMHISQSSGAVPLMLRALIRHVVGCFLTYFIANASLARGIMAPNTSASPSVSRPLRPDDSCPMENPLWCRPPQSSQRADIVRVEPEFAQIVGNSDEAKVPTPTMPSRRESLRQRSPDALQEGTWDQRVHEHLGGTDQRSYTDGDLVHHDREDSSEAECSWHQ